MILGQLLIRLIRQICFKISICRFNLTIFGKQEGHDFFLIGNGFGPLGRRVSKLVHKQYILVFFQ
jgi:hypothetical protein